MAIVESNAEYRPFLVLRLLELLLPGKTGKQTIARKKEKQEQKFLPVYAGGGGHLVARLHIAGWWVCYTFKSEMVSYTIWGG